MSDCTLYVSLNVLFEHLKRIVHPQIKIVIIYSTHPQVVPNLYEFLSAVKHKRRYIEECW